MKARVLVRLKPGILDVPGASVKRALAGLGFAEVTDLRIGKVIELELAGPPSPATRGRLEEMCKKLLANPVLENYTIEPLEGDSLAPSGSGR